MIDKKFVFVDFNNSERKETLIDKFIEELQIIIVSSLNNGEFYNYFAFTGNSCLRLIYKEDDKFLKDLEFVTFNNKEYKHDYESYFSYMKSTFEALGIKCRIYEDATKEQLLKTFSFQFDYKNLIECFGLEQYKNYFKDDEVLEIKLMLNLKINKELEVEVIENDFPLYQVNCIKRSNI